MPARGLPDHAGAQHQPVRDDLRLGRVLLQRGQEISGVIRGWRRTVGNGPCKGKPGRFATGFCTGDARTLRPSTGETDNARATLQAQREQDDRADGDRGRDHDLPHHGLHHLRQSGRSSARPACRSARCSSRPAWPPPSAAS